MSHPKSNHERAGQAGWGLPRRIRTIGLAIALVGVALGGYTAGTGQAVAGAASPTEIHLFQKETTLTFYDASDAVIQGYPPVGGHVKEDDVDYVGDHLHHAKQWTVTDHQYCTVVSAPATAECSVEFAVGGSLIYADDFTLDLASSSNSETLAIDGGTGHFAGYSGTYSSTTVGNSNNSDVVLSLHK
jgi:hypothetical protein